MAHWSTPAATLPTAVNALLTELGARLFLETLVTSMVGDGAAVLVKRALTAAGLDPDTPHALERFLEHYDARLLDSTRPYPEMLEHAQPPSRRGIVSPSSPTSRAARQRKS